MNSETIFRQALAFFPKWMNINRRPYTSNQGQILQSIFSEFDRIQDALDDYRKDFFLDQYQGKEDTILSALYAAHTGAFDSLDHVKLLYPFSNFALTDSIETFQNERKSIYYQDGYLLIRQQFVTSPDVVCAYTYNGFTYGVKWIRMQVWNVFDEFAWFAGLERYENETNRQLSLRTRLAFKNRTNVTRQGLINSIQNCVQEYDVPSVIVEQPTTELMELPDDIYGTVFEHISQINKDLARTKEWDTTYWQNDFKKLDYLPHPWDSSVSIYQNGVGYNDSLKVTTTDAMKEETADITVTGYKKSIRFITEYIQNNNIYKQLSLQLRRYKNILSPINVQYKITATNIESIDPEKITFESYRSTSGRDTFCINDLREDISDSVTEEKQGTVAPGTYRVHFTSPSPVGTMQIQSLDLIQGDTKTSYIKPKGQFIMDGNVLINRDVAYYTDSVRNLNVYSNLKDSLDQTMCIEDLSQPATFSFTSDSIHGKYLNIEHGEPVTDISDSSQFISSKGFILDGTTWTDTSSSTSSELTISLSCTSISFSLLKENDNTKQGTIRFTIQDGKKNTETYQWDTPQTFSRTYDTLTTVTILIKKNGNNPVSIGSITASRYLFKVTTDVGDPFKTSMGYIIPDNAHTVSGTIQSYDNHVPFIKYIHVGSLLNNAEYVSDDIKVTDNSARLSIRSNCIAALENVTTKEIIKPFTTYSIYHNKTEETGYVFLDLSQFVSIALSEPEIYTTSYQGAIRSYIAIPPNSSVSTIQIISTTNQKLESCTLKEVLKDKSYDSLYTARDAKGIIIRKNNEDSIYRIPRSIFLKNANTFRILCPDTIQTAFTQDTNTVSYPGNDTFSGVFQDIYFIPKSTTEYVAYNTATVLQPDVYHVPLTYTFSPILSPETLAYYVVEDTDNANVSFEKIQDKKTTYTNWSLGRPAQGLHIHLNIHIDNIENYQAEVLTMKQNFLLSNSIPLQDTYTINDVTVELASYDIVPPDYLSVDYKTTSCMETIIAENDSFNKLRYVHIVNLLSIETDSGAIRPSDYTLLKDEGIIIWNNPSLYGQTFHITYAYQKPVSLTFKSLDYLYDTIGYVVDAYEETGTKEYTGVKDGDIIPISGEYDRCVAQCSNDGFLVQVMKDGIHIYANTTDNRVAVHNGWFYDDSGKEYWYFYHKKKETAKQYDGLDLIRTNIINGEIHMGQKTTNYIQNSEMNGIQADVLCILDFNKNHHIPEISTLKSLTACDSYAHWYRSNMDVSLIDVETRPALYFTSYENGYAVLDITNGVEKNSTLYVDSTGLTVTLAKDVPVNKNHMRKNILAQPVQEINQFYTFTSKERRTRYYLIIQGNGILRELVFKKNDATGHYFNTIFDRNIDKLHLQVKEKYESGSIVTLPFDSTFSKLDGLEFDRKDTLLMGSDVDYNITLLDTVNFSSCEILNVKYVDGPSDIFMTPEDESGTVLTPIMEVPNYRSLGTLDVVLNTVVSSDKYKGFVGELLCSDSPAGPFVSTFKDTFDNIFSINQRYVKRYIRVQITMPGNRFLDQIAILAEYNTQKQLPRIHTNLHGTMISKLFDTCASGNYVLKRILFSQIKPDVTISVRACRQNDTNTTAVWTAWTPVSFDENGNIERTESVTFRNYRLFQIRVTMNGKAPLLKLEGIQMEMIE